MYALYVGQNEAMRQQYKRRNGEILQYVYDMSLYPYVCKRIKFLMGHPAKDVGDACKYKLASLRKNGMIKFVVPPESLYHHVLPFIPFINSFCLRRTCVLTYHTGECSHTVNEDRALTGTWVMVDVRLAVNRGYSITEIYEVYEYQSTRYDPQTRDVVLFADVLATFLKL